MWLVLHSPTVRCCFTRNRRECARVCVGAGVRVARNGSHFKGISFSPDMWLHIVVNGYCYGQANALVELVTELEALNAAGARNLAALKARCADAARR